MERICSIHDFEEGIPLGRELKGKRVVLVKSHEGIFAFEDRCSHEENTLSDGLIEDYVVECMYHGARFDIRTGKALSLPAVSPIHTYKTEVNGDDVLISI